MVWFTGYVSTVFAANWLIAAYGLVPVGFGLMAPAGVYAAGLAFTFRDMTQETMGRWFTVGAVVLGAALSAFISPQFALASGAAFLLSELADMAVYTPLRERGRWLWAVAVSNTVGLVLDSALFLVLAFGSLDFLAGQVLAKVYMTAAAVGLLWMVKRANHLAIGSRAARTGEAA